MKIDLDVVLSDLDGKPLKERDEENKLEDVTLKRVCRNALVIPHKSENPSGDEKFKRYELAFKINAGGTQDFTPDEVVLIKKLIGLHYNPVVVGPAYKLLNQ